ncbi:MAG TPA: CpcT/CpeT family chromophore lyase [Steroidobacteraceae bacterium]|jgi:hypothetical protein|nr:CpcT/CpeT family chromophore lyase [Steroidobacteraceae bacterium]
MPDYPREQRAPVRGSPPPAAAAVTAGGTAAKVLAAAAAAFALAGCASQARHEQAAFEQLKQALPGVYESGSQGSAHAAASADQSVTLSIVPAAAQLIGDTVYFVRQTPADNARLVLSQGIWALTLEPKSGRILQRSYLLKDPRRWVGAAQEPDLLVAILPQDLQPLASCDLLWTQTPAGFEAIPAPPPPPPRRQRRSAHPAAPVRPEVCRPGSQAQGLWIERSAHLSGQQLILSERRTAADGALERTGAPLSLVLERSASAAGGSPTSPGSLPADAPPDP